MSITIESATPMFHVYDVPTSLAFYRDVLGFEIVNTSAPFSDAKDDVGWVMLRLNDVELMLNNMYENNVRPAAPDAVRATGHRDTTLYFSCADVDAAYADLRSKGVQAREPFVAYYGMKQVYLHDPDGYTLCLQQKTATDERG